MSENRFVSGNVIVLYCNFVKLESKDRRRHARRLDLADRAHRRRQGREQGQGIPPAADQARRLTQTINGFP